MTKYSSNHRLYTCPMCGEYKDARAQHCNNCRIHSYKHGMTHARTYKSWDCMIQRHDKHKGYVDAQVCERWQDFASFLTDMGERPSSDHYLGRNGDAGDYRPGNVTWMTRAENAKQAANRRQLTAGGSVAKRKLSFAERWSNQENKKEQKREDRAVRKCEGKFIKAEGFESMKERSKKVTDLLSENEAVKIVKAIALRHVQLKLPQEQRAGWDGDATHERYDKSKPMLIQVKMYNDEHGWMINETVLISSEALAVITKDAATRHGKHLGERIVSALSMYWEQNGGKKSQYYGDGGAIITKHKLNKPCLEVGESTTKPKKICPDCGPESELFGAWDTECPHGY